MMPGRLLRNLDRLLRGDATRDEGSDQEGIDISAWELGTTMMILASLSGVGIGSYALIRRMFGEGDSVGASFLQAIASGFKLPLLFMLTLLITVPSFYVFSTLLGSRLSIDSILRLMTGMLAIMMAVLGSLIPILLFFSLTTSNYAFIKILVVVICGFSGILGLVFLIRTFRKLNSTRQRPLPPARPAVDSRESEDGEDPAVPTLDQIWQAERTQRGTSMIFYLWIAAFGLVGAQMSWMLRPFIGSPDTEFTWLRAREGNFYLDIARSIGELFGA